jgi:hypothetical protein
MAELSDVPLGDLMKELQRRLECSYKPKKHLILIGARWRCSSTLWCAVEADCCSVGVLLWHFVKNPSSIHWQPGSTQHQTHPA